MPESEIRASTQVNASPRVVCFCAGRYAEERHIGRQGRFIWDVKTGDILHTVKLDVAPDFDRFMPAVRFSVDGARIVYRRDPRKFVVWDWKADKVVREFASPQDMPAAVISTDGRRVAAVDDPATRILVWDADSGSVLFTLGGLEPTSITVAISSDGRMVACNSDTHVLLWSLPATGGTVHQ